MAFRWLMVTIPLVPGYPGRYGIEVMILRVVLILVCLAALPSARAEELTPEQRLILACFHLDVDTTVSLLRDGVDVECTFGPGETKAHFQDPWSGGWPIPARTWTPLQALANSSRYPDPPRPYRNTSEDRAWARNAKNDIDPAEIAARNERRKAILLILLAKGCNVDTQDNRGASVLYSAIYNRHTEMVEMLLRYKANVNTKTGIYIDGPGNTTPLHVAKWSPKLTELLVAHGADESAVDTDGRTAEDYRRGTYPGEPNPFGADLDTDPFEEP